MDLGVLRRLIAELTPGVEGVRIDRVFGLPPVHLAFVLGKSGAPRLWFSAVPEDPHLYERPGGHPTPGTPPAFAMAARKLLSGRRVESLEVVGDDRVVTLRCADGQLWFELVPRRASALLVDSDGIVRAVWHPRRGRPQPGDPYAPPDRPTRPSVDDLTGADWRQLEAGADVDAVARRIVRSVDRTTLLVAREAAARQRAGERLEAALRDELRRAEEADTAARVYAPRPMGELEEPPPPADFLLAPYPLRQAGHLVASEFPGLRQAAAAFYPLRARLAAVAAARAALNSALDAGIARAERALRAVGAETPPESDAERYRRWGDLLLAHPRAEPRDGHVVVADAYAGGEPAEIAVDPSLSLVENAQRYYQRARRAERRQTRTRQRAAFLRQRIERLGELRGSIERARELPALRSLARRAAADGAEPDADRWGDPEGETIETKGETVETEGAIAAAGATEPPGERASDADVRLPRGRRVATGVVAFASSDGSEILVGRNAAGNERLTHRLASPDDWWLHAEGPGAHVVIRNPERLETPPQDALREAAALAAYYSAARGATKVNVHWTQVRQVKRPKGRPKGQVLLRRFRTVLAEPVAPEELLP